MPYRERYVTAVGAHADAALPVMRVGLGVVILLAGAHKLVAPGVWTAYAAPWVSALWPDALVSMEAAMVLNGAIEVLFGLALVAGVYPAIAAGIVALSMAAVVVNLLTGAATTGEHVDVLIRDVGLVVLATGVTLLSARREAGA